MNAQDKSGNFRQCWNQLYGCQLTPEQAKEYEERLAQLIKFVIDLGHKKRAPP